MNAHVYKLHLKGKNIEIKAFKVNLINKVVEEATSLTSFHNLGMIALSLSLLKTHSNHH